MQNTYTDLFFLVETRAESELLRIVSKILKKPQVMTSEFGYPEFGATKSFDTLSGLMQFLERDAHSRYGIYWRDADNEKMNCSAHYFDDGRVAIGISFPGIPKNVADYMRKISEIANSRHAYFGIGIDPPDSPEEIISRSGRSGQGARIHDGKLLLK